MDKLRRDPTLKLKSIHDLAGARLVIDGTRHDQDAASDRIVEAFAACSKPPIVKDRRDKPSHGYRAVHVIVFPEDIPVEIQIRTVQQNRWAQATESLGDSWGRGLRYGEGPDEPNSLAGPPFAPSLTRAQVVEKWAQISDLVASMEQLQLDVDKVRNLTDSGGRPDEGVLDDLQRRLPRAQATIRQRADGAARLTRGPSRPGYHWW